MNEDRVSEKTVAEVAARAGKAFERLVQTMATLRAPGGCPWDAEQTHQSLIRYLIEESYEVVEAVEAPEGTNLQLLREELGDVLCRSSGRGPCCRGTACASWADSAVETAAYRL